MQQCLEIREDAYALASVGPVQLVLWRGTLTRESFDRFAAQTDQMILKYPEGFTQLQVIESTSEPPSSELRRESSRVMKRMRGTAIGVAFVIEGDGLKTSIARSILRGMALLSHGAVPLHYFAQLPEALTWTTSQFAPGEIGPVRITQMFATMREQPLSGKAAGF